MINERLKGIPIPQSMQDLPIHRGFPVPWFVDWIDGKPEFRAMDIDKKYKAVREALCWVCGKAFTTRKRYFVVGPMCVLNRNTSEPPCHLDCAEFSARGCPFLAMPKMVRRENDMPANKIISVGAVMRNPGATAIYYTRSFKPYYPDGRKRGGDFLIELGEPVDVSWWAEGAPATREQVLAAIDSGIPIFEAACEQESTPERREQARAHLKAEYQNALKLLPRLTEVTIAG